MKMPVPSSFNDIGELQEAGVGIQPIDALVYVLTCIVGCQSLLYFLPDSFQGPIPRLVILLVGPGTIEHSSSKPLINE